MLSAARGGRCAICRLCRGGGRAGARRGRGAGAQVGGFLGAGAGVVEEQDEGAVAQRERSVGGQAGQQVLDLFAFEEEGFWRGGALDRDGGDLLADGEHFRCPCGDVLEEAVQGGQPLVAGADVVAAVLLEVAQEGHDLLEGEVGEGQAGDLAALGGGGECQEEPDGVAVAADRGGAQAFDRDEVVSEEGVQDRSERLGRFMAPPGSRRARRRPRTGGWLGPAAAGSSSGRPMSSVVRRGP